MNNHLYVFGGKLYSHPKQNKGIFSSALVKEVGMFQIHKTNSLGVPALVLSMRDPIRVEGEAVITGSEEINYLLGKAGEEPTEDKLWARFVDAVPFENIQKAIKEYGKSCFNQGGQKERFKIREALGIGPYGNY